MYLGKVGIYANSRVSQKICIHLCTQFNVYLLTHVVHHVILSPRLNDH